MAIRPLETDFKSVALAAIEKDARSWAAKSLPFKGVRHNVTIPLITNPRDDPMSCRESVQENAAISSQVSAQVHAVYEQLLAYRSRTPESLTKIQLPSIDLESDFLLQLTIAAQSFDIYPDFCKHRIWHSHRLWLSDTGLLPNLPFVKKLGISSGGTTPDHERVRPLSLRLPFQCFVRLPSIRELDLPWMWERLPIAYSRRAFREYTRCWEGPWRDQRHDFAAVLMRPEEELGNSIPASLEKARMHFWEPLSVLKEDQAAQRPNLIHPAPKDPVSVSLCELAVQLEEFDLRALLTPDLFPVAGTQQWSNMRRLRIEFHPLRPDGLWYFIGPRGEDPHSEGGFIISDADHYPPLADRPEDKLLDQAYAQNPDEDVEVDYLPDHFRTAPCRERIEPLLSAFATALENTDKLEDAYLFAFLSWRPSESRQEQYEDELPYQPRKNTHRWGVRYLAASGSEGGSGPTVEWQVGSWKPSQAVMQLFEDLGHQEWLDFEYYPGRPTYLDT
ncbi:uncharacterized protein B0I36DRAFT_294475 [Microdochium trichocladiopsis]|uniref:Uncharacterized protein n=1 Tax=Microdochium trichocladiopsis TaxID=1682393 RepID=A0A9P8Y0F7_9PEZI|nr:uncharacterized protein B0I36DRAFT_294475 [Microdochium trichocladiopsis]KAH7026448.1 hypothetical protein B0I36DRAFT_294475 [Microdochium trichocladiopsis]